MARRSACTVLSVLLMLCFGVSGISLESLRVITWPSSTQQAGRPWSTPPQVEALVRDSWGKLVRDPFVSADKSVIVTLETQTERVNPDTRRPFTFVGGATSLTSKFVNGVANFSDLAVPRAGVYRLRFAVPQEVQTVSPLVRISGLPPLRLEFASPPATAFGGMAFKQQPSLRVVDSAGALSSLLDGLVFTATIEQLPSKLAPGAPDRIPTLSGSLSAALVGGVAKFDDLALNVAGSGYRLAFTHDSFTAAGAANVSTLVNQTLLALSPSRLTSPPFTVSVGGVTNLYFAQTPGSPPAEEFRGSAPAGNDSSSWEGEGLAGSPQTVTAAVPFARQPILWLLDAGGNIAEADSFSVVEARLYADPTGGEAKLGPTYVRRRYPVSVIAASVTTGSEYVALTADPAALGVGNPHPRLANGDRVSVGGSAADFATSDNPGVAWETITASSDAHALVTSTGALAYAEPFPPASQPGALVRMVSPGSGHRMRLQVPWSGPSMNRAPLTKVETALLRPAISGRVVFEGLNIDKTGLGYRLLFLLHQPPNTTFTKAQEEARTPAKPTPTPVYKRRSDGVVTTPVGDVLPPGAIFAVSPLVHVAHGAPHSLQLVRPAAGAWAGNQPFRVQPLVAILDAGGSIVSGGPGEAVLVEASLVGGRDANPTGALLLGNTRVLSRDGLAEWSDLKITKASWPADQPYRLLFTARVPGYGFMSTEQDLKVLVSAEWEVTSFIANATERLGTGADTGSAAGAADPRGGETDLETDGEAGYTDPGGPGFGDRFGHGTSVAGTVAAVSAPYDDEPKPDIHIVQVTSDVIDWLPETQLITVKAVWRPEVQRFALGVTPNATLEVVNATTGNVTASYRGLGGTFTLTFNGKTTRPIPANADPKLVQVILEADCLNMEGGDETDGRGEQGHVIVTLEDDRRMPRESNPLTQGDSYMHDDDAADEDDSYYRVWQFVFPDIYSYVPLLHANVSGVTGPNVTGNVTQEQPATTVKGFFRLALPDAEEPAGRIRTSSRTNADMPEPGSTEGRFPGSDGVWPDFTLPPLAVTRPIPYDTNDSFITTVLREDLQMGNVLVYDATKAVWSDKVYYGRAMGLKAWRVTFPASPSAYDPPTLYADPSGLDGYRAGVDVATTTKGQGPLGGTFRLHSSGVPTSPLPFDAAADIVLAALEKTGVCEKVEVTRQPPQKEGAPFTWVISMFRRARADWSPEVAAAAAKLPALEWKSAGATYHYIQPPKAPSRPEYPSVVGLGGPDTPTTLSGTGARVTVTVISSATNTQPWKVGSPAAGDAGYQQGSVYLYRRSPFGFGWQPVCRLHSPSGAAYDWFGHSVSLAAGPEASPEPPFIAIGAPGTRNEGELEVQSITCAATDGFFTFRFRDAESPQIPYDADMDMLRDALEGIATLKRVVVTPTGRRGDRVCNATGSVTRVTFVFPQDGNLEALEPVVVDPLSGPTLIGTVTVQDDVVRGSRKSSGFDTTGGVSGSVYIFAPPSGEGTASRVDDASPLAASRLYAPWSLTHRLIPNATQTTAATSSSFGWAVAANAAGARGVAHTIAVGAPSDASAGYFDEGVVHIYVRVMDPATGLPRDAPGEWQHLQTLDPVASIHQTRGAGFRFGWSVAFASEGDTLAVGMPGADRGWGRVYVFKRQPSWWEPFLFDQILTQPASSLLVTRPSHFGYSVGFGPNVLVVGAPDAVADSGTGKGMATGGAYVYTRVSYGDRGGYLKLQASVYPDTADEGDRVGIAVAAARDVVVVGSTAELRSGIPNGVVGPAGHGADAMDGQSLAVGTPQLEAQAVTLQVPAQFMTAGVNGSVPHFIGYFTLLGRRKWVPELRFRDAALLPPQVKSSIRVTRSSGWVRVESRRLPWNASPQMVRAAVEEDLALGPVKVTRREPPPGAACCHTWAITFLGSAPGAIDLRPGVGAGRATSPPLLRAASYLRLTDKPTAYAEEQGWLPVYAKEDGTVEVSAMQASYDALSDPSTRVLPTAMLGGDSRISVVVTRLSEPSRPVRGTAYVYSRTPLGDPAGVWVPDAALLPHSYQHADQFGASVAMSFDGSGVVVGAPTRSVLSANGKSRVNAGSAFMYDLSILNMRSTAIEAALATKNTSAIGTGAIRVTEGVPAASAGTTAAELAAHKLDMMVSTGTYPPGLALPVDVPLAVCQPYCVVPPPAPASGGASVQIPAGHTAVVSAHAGDDWGFHDLFSGRVPPSGALATQAHGSPAVSYARGVGSLDPAAAPWALGAYDGAATGQYGWVAPVTADDTAHASAIGSAYPMSDCVGTSATERSSAMTSRCLFSHMASSLSAAFTPNATLYRPPSLGGYDAYADMDFAHVTHIIQSYVDYDKAEEDTGRRVVWRGEAGRPRLAVNTGNGTADDAAAARLAVPAAANLSIPVLVVDDDVMEAPDETLHVRLGLPGLWPLYGGHLWTPVVIEDNGDGTSISGGSPRSVYQHLHASDVPLSEAEYLSSSGASDSGITAVPRSVVDADPQPGVSKESPALHENEAFGTAVAVAAGLAVVGSPGATDGVDPATRRKGRAVLYAHTADGWVPALTLRPPHVLDDLTATPSFGSSVTALLVSAGAPVGGLVPTLVYVAVGAPVAPAVTLYACRGNRSITTSASDPSLWVAAPGSDSLVSCVVAGMVGTPMNATGVPVSGDSAWYLRDADALDGYGAPRTIALTTDGVGGLLLAVGCPGLEAVFVYRNVAPAATAAAPPSLGGATTAAVRASLSAPWPLSVVLRASDFLISGWGEDAVHFPARFGSAVSASGQTLAVGAPLSQFAITRSLPDGLPVGFSDTQDVTQSYGTGAVYVFQYLPGIVSSDYGGSADHHDRWEDLAGWWAGDVMLARNGSVHVLDDAEGEGLWAQQVILVPQDAAPGDRVGEAVALDGASLVVGAWGSPGQPDVSWDFETGDLRGWTATGAAFARQPTLGDNPAARPEYAYAASQMGDRPSQKAGINGRYFVGTYEARPADLPATFQSATPARDLGDAGQVDAGTTGFTAPPAAQGLQTPAGTLAGDGPTGTLVSRPFLIAGPQISFLVGGGCDERLVYVQLAIDGTPVLRASGACSEEMRRVVWDVRPYKGRSGVIRIVDASSTTPWGHINVDDFRFAWDIGHFVETHASGAAYVFSRVTSMGRLTGGVLHTSTEGDARTEAELVQAPGGGFVQVKARTGPTQSDTCPNSGRALGCVWQQEAKLQPSGKRTDTRFGIAVAVNDAAGIALVGAVYGGLPDASWALPGSTDSVRSASTHEQSDLRTASVAADGTASAAALYGRSAASIRHGGFSNVEAGNLPSRSAARKWWVGGPASQSSAAFTASGKGLTSGASSGQADEIGWDNPFYPLHDPDPAAGIPDEDAAALVRLLAGYSEVTGEGHGTLVGGASPRQAGWADVSSAGKAVRSSGAVYVFRATPEKRGGGAGKVVSPRVWHPSELAMLDVPAWNPLHARGRRVSGALVGGALAMDGWGALIAAPSDSSRASKAGSLAAVDLTFAYTSFSSLDIADPARQAGSPASVQAATDNTPFTVSASGAHIRDYAFSEGISSRKAVIPVYRHGLRTLTPGTPQYALKDTTITLRFGTRDVTAAGISADRAKECYAMLPDHRGPAGCGDYVHMSGDLVFPPGATRRDIVIPLMDDKCYRPGIRTFAVQLYLPGGVGLRGEEYTVTVRIDEDDFDTQGKTGWC